ncbi:MAG: hypothetical protein GVY25_10710 [Bacteroidetes bacterium]|jgi:uncharacterized Zn-binding protein involved in type VI secretion|nr:hypothetical protein [Bacteroidota bacterium]
MSKPAARIGDMTAHGGSIVAGMPTVLIGGMPAARLGDMHVCPMATPALPPVPHVGGPVTLGSAGVMIGGMPAARMGDMCVCTGPPDSIVMGCPTVLIGEVGAGAASGGAGGGGGGAAGARASAAAATIDTGVSTTKEEHWIEFEFVDSAGIPVAGVPYTFVDPDGVEQEGMLRTDGTIRVDGVSEGEGEVVLKSVHAAQWDTDRASADDKLTLTADVIGFEDGTPAQVQIFERDLSGGDTVVADIQTTVENEAVEVKWRYEYPTHVPDDDELRSEDEQDDVYSAPDYYFEVIVGPCTARSPVLPVVDTIEIEVATEEGDPVTNQPYVLITGTGERRTGTLDQRGKAKETDVPVSDCILRIPELPDLEAGDVQFDVDEDAGSDDSASESEAPSDDSFQIQIHDGETDFSNVAYTVDVGGRTVEGRTDREGWTEPFPLNGAEEMTVHARGHTFQIELANDYQSTLEEVRSQLNALGYSCGDVDGDMGPRTRSAIRAFQKENYLPVTGEVNAVFQRLLRSEFRG